jgi:hypothetical protein
MKRPTFQNIVLYLFVKYCVFFGMLALMENRFKKMVINNSENCQELFINTFYYIVYVLVYTLFLVFVISGPIYLSFKTKYAIFFMPLIATILVGEYFLYTWSASQTDLINGVHNGIISVLFLFLFFYRRINLMFKISPLNKTRIRREH